MDVMPITAVRSSGFTTAAMNADRGAWSKEFNPVLMNIKITVIGTRYLLDRLTQLQVAFLTILRYWKQKYSYRGWDMRKDHGIDQTQPT